MSELKPVIKSDNPDGDWPEDARFENGSYLNICHECNNTFIGYKRRLFCKVCDTRKGGEDDA